MKKSMLKMQNQLFDDTIESGAQFSTLRTHRFALWRIWDRSKPLVAFFGLNPSTANEFEPDPTIKSVTRISKNLGYGGFYMLNGFSYVSTNPDDLNDFNNQSENDQWIEKYTKECADVIFAWGAFEVMKQRGRELAVRFPNAKALIINKDGSPRHPLYVKGSVQPFKWEIPELL